MSRCYCYCTRSDVSIIVRYGIGTLVAGCAPISGAVQEVSDDSDDVRLMFVRDIAVVLANTHTRYCF